MTLYYDKDQFDKATPLFLDVVSKYPGSELAVYAINLHLDSLNQQRKTREVCAAVPGFLKSAPAARDAELAAQLRGLRRDCEIITRKTGAPAGGK